MLSPGEGGSAPVYGQALGHATYERLQPLLAVITETFMPLMRQNAAAYLAAVEQGQALFNEAAFDRGEALYDGTLMDQPFRSVARSFQVPVWRDPCRAWKTLDEAAREQLRALCPQLTDEEFTCAVS